MSTDFKSWVVVAAKRNAKETLQTAIARMPYPIQIPPNLKRIILKPSICYVDLPGNTSLQMMSAITDMFRRITSLSIVESDNPMRTAEEAFESMRYTSLVEDHVELINLSRDEQILTTFAGNGIRQENVSEILLKNQFLVNVATLKKQGDIVFGAGIKNLFGLLGRRDKNNLHSNLDGILLDLLIRFRPKLSIIDLTELVIGDRQNKQTKSLGGVIIGTDPVAVDAYCAHLLGHDPLKVSYIRNLHELGLGEALPERIKVHGTSHQIEKVEAAFRF